MCNRAGFLSVFFPPDQYSHLMRFTHFHFLSMLIKQPCLSFKQAGYNLHASTRTLGVSLLFCSAFGLPCRSPCQWATAVAPASHKYSQQASWWMASFPASVWKGCSHRARTMANNATAEWMKAFLPAKGITSTERADGDVITVFDRCVSDWVNLRCVMLERWRVCFKHQWIQTRCFWTA